MKRGFEALSLVSGLIVLLLVVAVLFQVSKIVAKNLDRTENVNAVRTWALIQSQTQKTSTERAGTQRPPVPNLGGTIVIENENQLKKAQKDLANGMYDCWSAFGQGDINFLEAIGGTRFCYPCVQIVIDDS